MEIASQEFPMGATRWRHEIYLVDDRGLKDSEGDRQIKGAGHSQYRGLRLGGAPSHRQGHISSYPRHANLV